MIKHPPKYMIWLHLLIVHARIWQAAHFLLRSMTVINFYRFFFGVQEIILLENTAKFFVISCVVIPNKLNGDGGGNASDVKP